ncbi:uncharacterized protein LOC135500696 [Lineus longissimus]|uniref:uncharacterized protein LOC135500696 n=1 Tax=Lineus longissimus TaxID=88925 RepID=UPI002B4D9E0C
MMLMLQVILLAVIKSVLSTATCSTNFTALAKSCMQEVEQEFSLSVSKILAKDAEGTRELCRKYQEMYYCLHSVLDPCSTLGKHYFSLIQRRVVSNYGQHCPGVSPDSRRTTPSLPVYHVTTTEQTPRDVSSEKMNRQLKSASDFILPDNIFVISVLLISSCVSVLIIS